MTRAMLETRVRILLPPNEEIAQVVQIVLKAFNAFTIDQFASGLVVVVLFGALILTGTWIYHHLL